MTTEIKLAAAIEAVNGTLLHHQAIYVNGKALTARAEMARLEFMNRIQVTSGDGTPLNIERGHPEIEVILGLDSSARYLSTQGIAQAVTSSPVFIEAEAILSPLIAEVRRLEEQLAAEQLAAGIVANKRQAAIAEATAKALAEVEARFAEPAASPQAGPVPLVRGKITTRPKLEIEILAAE